MMIGSLFHMSVVIWETNILFAEINEEIENVLEDESSVEAITVSFSDGVQITEHWLKTNPSELSSDSELTTDYFEITSPPPDYIV